MLNELMNFSFTLRHCLLLLKLMKAMPSFYQPSHVINKHYCIMRAMSHYLPDLIKSLCWKLLTYWSKYTVYFNSAVQGYSIYVKMSPQELCNLKNKSGCTFLGDNNP